jgi:hypothetical protein
MISVRAIMPPPPTPWIERPTRITVKLSATAATIEPTVKNSKASRIKGFLPKIFEKDAKLGWNTVEHSRNEVPAQKASIAVPCSFSAMIGSATEIDVASSAAASVIYRGQRCRKQRKKRI